jgi:hypothetical protein
VKKLNAYAKQREIMGKHNSYSKTDRVEPGGEFFN